jgi:hypothetical protein
MEHIDMIGECFAVWDMLGLVGKIYSCLSGL